MGKLLILRYSMVLSIPTVSAHIEARGSIFLSGFLGGALIKFIIPGLLIELGFYYLQGSTGPGSLGLAFARTLLRVP